MESTSLTAEQRKYMMDNKQCPLCKDGYLQQGPEGGCSFNCRCSACFMVFWVSDTWFEDVKTIGIKPDAPKEQHV